MRTRLTRRIAIRRIGSRSGLSRLTDTAPEAGRDAYLFVAPDHRTETVGQTSATAGTHSLWCSPPLGAGPARITQRGCAGDRRLGPARSMSAPRTHIYGGGWHMDDQPALYVGIDIGKRW